MNLLPGYVVHIGESYDYGREMLQYLHNSKWLDRYTETVRLEMFTYAPHLNLLTILKVQFDVNHPVGFMLDEYSLDTIKMYRSTHNFGVFIFILELAYAAYAVYFATHVFKSIIIRKKAYFESVWSLLDVSVVFISLSVMVFYAVHYYYVTSGIEQYQKTKEVRQFEYVVLLDYGMTYCLGLLVSCAVLKFLHMLRFNPVIYTFLTVLNRSKVTLFGLAWIMFLIFIWFAQLMQLIAGRLMKEYSEFSRTFVTQYLAVLGEYDMVALQEVHPTWGPLALFTFLVIAVYLTLNLLISLLCCTMKEVSQEELPNEDARLLQLLIDKLLQWVGITRNEKPKEKSKVKRKQKPKEKRRKNIFVDH